MNIKEMLKGVIIGVAKIIPGLSGAVLMISFGLYDRAINALTNFFDNPKSNFLFLFNLGIGIVFGVVMFSNVISYFINNYYVYTTCLFIGLILGGVPVIVKDTSKSIGGYFIAILAFVIMIMLSLSGINNDYIPRGNFIDIVIYFIAGLLEAFGTIVPGISSTALLMLMGVYDIFLESIGSLYIVTKIWDVLWFLIPFSVGLLLGVMVITLIINYLFKFYKSKTFSFILGVTLSSVVLLFIRVSGSINTFESLVICLSFVVLGYVITSKMS